MKDGEEWCCRRQRLSLLRSPLRSLRAHHAGWLTNKGAMHQREGPAQRRAFLCFVGELERDGVGAGGGARGVDLGRRFRWRLEDSRRAWASTKVAAWSAATRFTVQPPKPPPVSRAPKQPGLFVGEVDEDVQHLAAGGTSKSSPEEADVGLVHEFAEAGEVGGAEGFDGGEDTVVFSDDVAAAAEDVGLHLATPEREVLHGGVAESAESPGGGRGGCWCLLRSQRGGCCIPHWRRSA